MSQRTGIFFDLISQYNDAGARKAYKSFNDLNSLAGKLAKTMGVTFSAAAVVAFGRSSVNAFAQANKQFTVMNQTLNNLGLNVGITRLEEFFNKLEMKFGKDKSILIPAFQTLINSTKSYAKSQELLNLALDVSAGTGKDLGSVALALGKAYVGQTTSIVRLGIGYSAASIKGKTFLQVQKELTNQFSGSAAQAATTFQGKLDKLSVGFGNMKEAIGKGIVDALTAAAGKSGDIDHLTKSMVSLGEETANVLKFVGDLAGALGKVAGFFFSVKNNGQQKFSKYFGADISKIGGTSIYNPSIAKAAEVQRQREIKQADAAARAEAAAAAKALANQKALTAEKKKQLELQKAQAILNQAAKLLDLDQAQVVAAMMNESLTQNEMLRLQLKKALLDDNAKSAASFAQQLVASQIAALQLAAANPFGQMNLDIMAAIKSLQEFAAALAALSQTPATITRLSGLEAFRAKVAAVPDYEQYASPWQFGGASADPVYQMTQNGTTVTIINATGTPIESITQNNSLSGTPTNATRLNPLSWGNL